MPTNKRAIRLYVSEEEKKHIEELAKAKRQSASKYILSLVPGMRVKVTKPDVSHLTVKQRQLESRRHRMHS